MIQFMQLQLDRQDQGTLQLSWRGDPALGRICVYCSLSPDRILEQGDKLGEARGEDAALILEDPHPGIRTYYLLQPEHAAPRIIAERRLPLEGAVNFRDLGGYETVEGKFIKWGRLFRSEQLSDLTEGDIHYLQHCGLKLICDYRSEDEPLFAAYPEMGSIRSVRLPIKTMESILPGDRLLLANQNYVARHSREFAAMLDLLLEDSLPALQHCVAGKDRTGFGTAVVLLALGVPELTVMEDYLLTNKYKDALLRKLLAGRVDMPDSDLLQTRPEYLQAALDEIRSRYGGVASYLEHGLGFTPTKRKALQALLLSEH
jgi:protein-tyrosine phosphatase